MMTMMKIKKRKNNEKFFSYKNFFKYKRRKYQKKINDKFTILNNIINKLEKK